jgi:hypothetical protein
MAVKSRIGARKLRTNFQLNFIRNLDARVTRVEGRCWPRVDGRSVRSVALRPSLSINSVPQSELTSQIRNFSAARQHFCTKDEDAGLIPRFKDAHFVRDLNAMTLSSSAIYVP